MAEEYNSESQDRITELKKLLEAKDAWITDLESRLKQLPTVDGYKFTLYRLGKAEALLIEYNSYLKRENAVANKIGTTIDDYFEKYRAP